MQKTPDEIKKGLDNPIHAHYHISDIEPRMTPLDLHDLEFLHTDALAYIQQLEAQNAELLEKVEKLKTERDAAVNFWRSMGCDTCMYDDYDGSEPPCINCTAERPYWMWRGVQKEEAL